MSRGGYDPRRDPTGKLVMSEPQDRPQPRVVSVQSQLVYGCAGNSAAVPLLQRLGVAVHAVPTILLSNTPRYPECARQTFDGAFLRGLFDALLARLNGAPIDAILTGYMGSAEAVFSTASFIDRVRGTHPECLVVVDPVMGEVESGLYIPADVARAIVAELVPRAVVLTPNTFESSTLFGEPGDQGGALARPAALGDAARARLVIDTGRQSSASDARIPPGDGPPTTGDWLVTAAASDTASWRVASHEFALRPTGTGDCLAALFLGHWLHRDLGDAAIGECLRAAVDGVTWLIEQAWRDDREELDPTRFDAACRALHSPWMLAEA